LFRFEGHGRSQFADDKRKRFDSEFVAVGKKAKAKRESKKQAGSRPILRPGPNWPLLVIAGLGIVLASYLSWTEWTGNSVKGCAAGSSCDVVLSSRWAKLFGLPTAFWGLLTYVTLAGTAFIRDARRHWTTAWILALFGALYSAYLTTISITVLGATCPYCLTSLALMTSIFVLVTLQRPGVLESFSWPRLLRNTVPVAAAIIVVLHLHYAGILGEPPAPEDPTARALAIHLARSGARMYGAYWCPHCQQQKEMFGASADRLPYIECSPGGQSAPQAAECRNQHIESYPTWIINGKRFEEVMNLKQLAEAAGFQPAAAEKNEHRP
jgi:uncharacterized membrane protein/Zn ribbon nucleic-acid-binding protein